MTIMPFILILSSSPIFHPVASETHTPAPCYPIESALVQPSSVALQHRIRMCFGV